MKKNRRTFIKESVTSTAGLLALSSLPSPNNTLHKTVEYSRRKEEMAQPHLDFRFAVIGINHDHINGQIGATTRGGGEFVSFYAKEPELAAAFAKKYPNVKQARSQNEILEDKNIQLVLSAGFQ
jgi:hypothetical protein